jgi:hypothetical protein
MYLIRSFFTFPIDDAANTLCMSQDLLQHSDTHLILHHSGNFVMSIHGSWGDWPSNVMGYCSDDADIEADGGKVSKESL